MLWSLLKILIFIAIVAAVTLGAGYLMETSGGLQLTAAGREFTLGPLQSVIAVVVLLILVWLLLKLVSLTLALIHFLNGDETALSRWWDRNRERKGYQALSEGMMALASGEGHVAMTKAARAERYLNKPELTDLMTAQAAEMTGDRKKAEEVYKKLITRDETKFVGVRGILRQRLGDGDKETARALAAKAHELKPKHEEVQDVLLQLQAEAEDWAGARRTLDAKLRYGTLPRDVHKRREAVLAVAQAREVVEGDSIEAREAAIEANRLSPDLVPAAVMAAKGYIAQNKPRYATRVLRKAWEAQPHPELAAAFAAIAPEETPAERVKRFQTLTKIHPDHRETQLLLAELHIANEDFPAARRALGDLVERDADARALTIMAAVERGEGASDTVVKGWLARALNAPRGPQWVCQKCHHIHAEWTPICDNCQAFDTLSWERPPAQDVTSPMGVAMLPLIVGQIEDNGAEAAQGDDVEEAEVIGEEAVTPPPPDTAAAVDTDAPPPGSTVIDAAPEDADAARK